MAWRQIGNSLYYYRSRREGGRVVTDYIGRGELAGLIDLAERGFRERIEAQRAQRKADREEFDRAESDLREWYGRTERLANLALGLAGYHNHRGQWRRRKHGGNRNVEAATQEGI